MVRFSISGDTRYTIHPSGRRFAPWNQVPSGRFSAVPSARFSFTGGASLSFHRTPVMWRVRCSPWLKKGLSSQKVPMPSPSGSPDAVMPPRLFSNRSPCSFSRYRARPASQAVLSGSAVRVSRRWVG